MKKVNDKIEQLEKSMRDDFKWNSTIIDPLCLTQAERRLFEQALKVVFLKNPKEINDYECFLRKEMYYGIRRALDFFMKMMSMQLVDFDDKYLFWLRFIDFLHETMYYINRNRGTKILLDRKVGEDPDNWPVEEDPVWKEFEKTNKKWERDFKEFWDQTSPSMKKIFSSMEANLNKNQEIIVGKSPVSVNEVFGELITDCICRPTVRDIAFLVNLSASEKSKTLMEILSDTNQSKNSDEKIEENGKQDEFVANLKKMVEDREFQRR